MVPNIKQVQMKSVMRIQSDLNELREKGDKLLFSSSDLSDGTFSISNIGNIGGRCLNPCIMPPQVAILAITKIYDSIRVFDEVKGQHKDDSKNKFECHKVINFCFSADHRVIDGATIARFSEVLRNYIENPLKILTEE